MSAGKNGQVRMQDDIQKAINGELTDEQVKELETKLSDAAKKEMRELMAIKKQRKSEETRLEEARKGNLAEEERKKKEKETADAAAAQAKKDKVSQAKAKFFEQYKIPVEEQSKYSDAEFAKFDSGATEVEAIVKDWLKIYGSINAESLAAAQKKAEEERVEREKQAAIEAARGAGTHTTTPPGNQAPKYSDEVQKIAKDSGITLEAAEKIATQGRSRVLEG